MDRKKLFRRLLYLILLIFVANFLANKFYWYFSIWYFDMIMHFLGGLWLGLASFYIFSSKNSSNYTKLIFKTLIFVLIIGLGWELFEFSVDKVITQNILNIVDSSSDIFFDLAGGACAIIYFFKRIMFIKENTVE